MAKRILDMRANPVESVALVHEQLHRASDLSSIGLPDYLKELTENPEHTNRSLSTRMRLRLQADALRVGLQGMIALQDGRCGLPKDRQLGEAMSLDMQLVATLSQAAGRRASR